MKKRRPKYTNQLNEDMAYGLPQFNQFKVCEGVLDEEPVLLGADISTLIQKLESGDF